MRLRRDTIFRIHFFGVVLVACAAIFLHRSADSKRVDSLASEVAQLRKELSERSVQQAVSSSSDAVEIYDSAFDSGPPKIRIIGHGYCGRYIYLDCRLCDGVVRRCYIRRDPAFRSRDVERVSEIMDELNAFLWDGGYDLALSPSSVSSTPSVEDSSDR